MLTGKISGICFVALTVRVNVWSRQCFNKIFINGT